MKVSNELLFDKKQTSDKIKYLCKKHCNDLNFFGVRRGSDIVTLPKLSIKDFFNVVKNIPYLRDVSPVEVISRPLYILLNCFRGADCKKKAILCGSYCELNSIPYRFIGSSNKPNKRIHHIYPEILLNSQWVPFDATYNHFKLGQIKNNTAQVVL